MPRSDRCGRASGGRPVGIAPSSLTVATLVLPRSVTIAVGTTTATSDPNKANLVRANPNSTSNALIPTATAAQLMSPGWVAMYQAFWLATPPLAFTPSRSGNWPMTMFTDTPVRNPSITERDTNRMYRPSRKIPAAIITAPVSMVSRTRALARSSAPNSSSADPAASDAAVVVVTTIIVVLVVRPPPILPANEA